MSSTPLYRSITALCLFLFFLLPLKGWSQTTTVTGKVIDGDGVPIQGASVLVKGTTLGATTQPDGSFSIKFTRKGNDVLIFSYVGYNDKEVKVGSTNIVSVQLERNTESMNAVVVVGYGTQKKRDVTGSVVSIPKERLQQLPNNNILSALQGSVPGISVLQGSAGAEGNGVSILVRGRKSISADGSPLIIWDGIPYVGGISDINVADVESIEVLKDASATAIYGSRGSNGVILITSKQGRKGKLSVTYDGSYSVQTLVNKPDLLSGPEFAKFKAERANATTNGLDAQEQAVFDAGKWVDWYALATRIGARSQHSISVRSGTDKFSFYLGGTFLDVEGVVKNDKYRRYSLRPNLTVKLTKWLEFTTSSQISFADRSGVAVEFDDTRNAGGGANFFNPLTEPYNADGTINMYAYDAVHQAGNPLNSLNTLNSDNTYKIFTTNSLKVDVPFVKGLTYRLNTGVEYENNQRKTYYPRNTAVGFESNGDAINFSSVDRNFTVENILNYSREFGKHSINVTALYSSQSEDYDRDQLEGEGFPNDALTNYQMNAAALLTPSSTYYKSNLLSQMGRINYGYDGRYLLTLTARRDGYSAFGPSTKYGTYPSVAVGWNIVNESFMSKQDLFSQLKLRASYGLTGNRGVSPGAALAALGAAPYLDGGTTAPGYIPVKIANDDLGWESTKMLSFGVDFGLLKNRITGSVEYYRNNTYNLLLTRTLSPIQGIASVLSNIGKTKGHGIDFGVQSTNINKGDFTWSTNLNISYSNNVIVDLYGTGVSDKANKWFIGQPIRVAYGLQYDGFFKSQEEVNNSAQPTDKPGYVRVKDVDTSGTISTDLDRVILGNLDPKYTWGITNSFKYKNFSLMFFFQGAAGYVKLDEFQIDNVFGDTRRNTVKKDWWSVDNPNGTHYANDQNANKLSVPFYENDAFVRLKDLSISYNLPAKVLTKLNMASLKVYVTGRNLATFTKYKGLDPELSNNYGLPLQRDLLIGLTIGL